MNQIPNEQNEPRQLDRLAAQRNLYSTAKVILGAHVTISGPVAVVWAAVAILVPDLRGIAALWSVSLSLADLLWLTPWQKRLREQAALIQESFDCDVLGLPWNEIKVGQRPDMEDVKRHADSYNARPLKDSPLNDWYPPAVGELPLPVARVICQRTNCWWDAAQRQRYATMMISSVVLVIVFVALAGFATGITVEKFVLGVFVPLWPVLILGIRQYDEHSETSVRLSRLKSHADKLWAEVLEGTETDAKSRVLQDEIFENRKRSPLVFDLLYRWLRAKSQTHADYSAEGLIAEFTRKQLGG